jgi:hypothetical protein
MRYVAMQVVVYRTPHERIAYAERAIRRSIDATFGFIERQREAATFNPSEKIALFQAGQERMRLKSLITRWRVELTN